MGMNFDRGPLDIIQEVGYISTQLDKRKDLAYAAEIKEKVPSRFNQHGTRLEVIDELATDWLIQNADLKANEFYIVFEALWAMTWREERLIALELLMRVPEAQRAIEWDRIKALSEEMDNWEIADKLAGLAGMLLQQRPRMILQIEPLAQSNNAAQRRFALMSLIVGARGQDAWSPARDAMAKRLENDPDRFVVEAVAIARSDAEAEEAERQRG